MKKPEILAPAGNPEALDAAIGEGADAVYLGLKSFNARMRSNNFAYSQFEAAVYALHRSARKVYVTVNTVFEQREADRMYQFLKYLAGIGPDGIIVQDFGVARMAADHFPRLRLHASTQMNVSSARAVNYLSKFGFNRAVLARELTLDEITAIRQNTGLELEFFVHGALCMSVSGLCLFSSYLGGKSANRGMCTQACRRLYQAGDRTGYYFSPDDLEMIGFVPRLAEAGIDSFKIEGRMKSAEYVGTVVSAYRHVVDNWERDGDRAIEKARGILRNDFARRKTTYFIGNPDTLDFINPNAAAGTGLPLGVVKRTKTIDGVRCVAVKPMKARAPETDENGIPVAASPEGPAFDPAELKPGDSIRIHTANDEERITCKVVGTYKSDGTTFIGLAEDAHIDDTLYLLQTKSMSRRYPKVLPNVLESYRKLPGHETAPQPRLAAETRKPDGGKVPAGKAAAGTAAASRQERTAQLPEGIYVAVSSLADLYVLQAMKPKKAMFRLTRQSARDLEKGEPLPFKASDLIVWLDPFYPQGDEYWLPAAVEAIADRMPCGWVANNLAHIGMTKNLPGVKIAGPWLYSFNRHAAAFLMDAGLEYITSPLENNRQNLAKTTETFPKNRWIVPVFSYPALFRMRADLTRNYRFRQFDDKRDKSFFLFGSRDTGSVVIPSEPFSITDKIPALKTAGFSRFLVDFSAMPLRKQLYKTVMEAAAANGILEGASRFNWKDGFYSEERTASRPEESNEG